LHSGVFSHALPVQRHMFLALLQSFSLLPGL